MAYIDKIYHLDRCDKCQGITQIAKRNPGQIRTSPMSIALPVGASLLIIVAMIFTLGLVKLV